jgi:hypothetical protein
VLKSGILKLAAATVITAGSVAGVGVGVANASAPTATPASCAGNQYNGGKVTFTYCDGTRSKPNCFNGNNGAITGPSYAANGCQTQLYLYLGHTHTGTPALCVNPESSTGVLKKYYEEFVITSRTGKC